MRIADHFRRLKKRAHLWWHGEFKVKDSENLIYFYRDRSPWAKRSELVYRWLATNVWNVLFLIIGLLGIWLAI